MGEGRGERKGDRMVRVRRATRVGEGICEDV